jgi:hypothetical protein
MWVALLVEITTACRCIAIGLGLLVLDKPPPLAAPGQRVPPARKLG